MRRLYRSVEVRSFRGFSASGRGLVCFSTLCAVVIAAVSITSCRKPAAPIPTTAVQPQASPQHAVDSASKSDEQSCRAFVQKFYYWYWNQYSDEADDQKFDLRKLHSYRDAVRLNPPVLSQELIALIEKDEAASKAAGGDIVNLDFDPFLNSNGPVGRYTIKSASVLDGKCLAVIEGSHSVHEIAELNKTGSTWIFSNFLYSYYSEDGKTRRFPDDDLVHILNR